MLWTHWVGRWCHTGKEAGATLLPTCKGPLLPRELVHAQISMKEPWENIVVRCVFSRLDCQLRCTWCSQAVKGRTAPLGQQCALPTRLGWQSVPEGG